MRTYRSFFILFIICQSLTYLVTSSSVAMPSVSQLDNNDLEKFKDQFHKFGRKISLKSEILGQGDAHSDRWAVQVILPVKDCSSAHDPATTISPTGCRKDSESSSMRVSCHSSMILMEQFAFSTSCSGQPDSAWTTPIGQCLVSSHSSSVFSCIGNPALSKPAADVMSVKKKDNSTIESPELDESSSDYPHHSSETLTAICVSLSGLLVIALLVWWNYENIVDYLAKRNKNQTDRQYLAVEEIPEVL